jgi:hypothetical protein
VVWLVGMGSRVRAATGSEAGAIASKAVNGVMASCRRCCCARLAWPIMFLCSTPAITPPELLRAAIGNQRKRLAASNSGVIFPSRGVAAA